jgi:nitrogen-specific signal transduction histidine kinase
MKEKKVKEVDAKGDKAVALHYMKTLTDVARESFLILDSSLRVISANPIFYKSFSVSKKDTDGVLLYKLGNGQWDIPELKKLLEEILPQKKIVKNYEVQHAFQTIGVKTMLLNAGQIDSVHLILLAIEDITERKKLEEKLVGYTKGLEAQVDIEKKELIKRVNELEAVNKTMVGREVKMVELKKEIDDLKKQVKK